MESIESLNQRVAYEKGRKGYPEGFPHLPDWQCQRDCTSGNGIGGRVQSL